MSCCEASARKERAAGRNVMAESGEFHGDLWTQLEPLAWVVSPPWRSPLEDPRKPQEPHPNLTLSVR
jgi:hypothetical protein